MVLPRWKTFVRCTGRAGVPMEVMGLMLGDFVDEYTVKVVDVFAMPQSGTGVSVEAVDPVFQMKMLEMLKQVCSCAMVKQISALLSHRRKPACWLLPGFALRHQECHSM